MKRIRHSLKPLLFFVACFVNIQAANAIDLDTDNAALDVVIPAAVPAVFEISPSGGDATLVLRVTTLLSNVWFDASAPYHATANGIYSNLGRRPAAEASTNRNINIALLYGSYHVLNSLFPARANEWAAMLAAEGLDPNDTSNDLTSPVGIGNLAGIGVVTARENDGMNQLGNEGDQAYHRKPYADYLGFEPANSAYKLKRPSKWQPAIVSDRTGIFRVQQFVTPQMRVVTPYSYRNPNRFRAPYPIQSNLLNFRGYVAQANDVIDASANLTDEQKMASELFDNKIFSLGFSALFAAQVNGLSLIETVQYDFLTNMAAFDTAIAVWNEKYRYNAVRPFSAIGFIYDDAHITAWGGPGQGTVDDLPANQWTSYLPVADHPEYPSGSASFCGAHAESSRLYFGSDNLGYPVPTPQGSSRIEPGVTPANDIELYFPTWSDLEERCGQSRLWAGVHFPDSIPAGRDIGREVAQLAFKFFTDKVNGKK